MEVVQKRERKEKYVVAKIYTQYYTCNLFSIYKTYLFSEQF
jgi:hypothetical protein